MTDTDKLKRLAEELKSAHVDGVDLVISADRTDELYPRILALIAENERFAQQYAELAGQVDALMGAYPNPAKALDRLKRVIAERDEAVALLRRSLGYIHKWEGTMHHDIRAFLARIDAA